MTVYKSSGLVLLKSAAYGIFGGAAISVVSNIFLRDIIAIAAGLAVGALYIYFTLLEDNIKIVIDGDSLSVYRLKKMKYTFDLSRADISSKIRTKSFDSTCFMTVVQEEKETRIDCSMLGKKRFIQLIDDLRETPEKPPKSA